MLHRFKQVNEPLYRGERRQRSQRIPSSLSELSPFVLGRESAPSHAIQLNLFRRHDALEGCVPISRISRYTCCETYSDRFQFFLPVKSSIHKG